MNPERKLKLVDALNSGEFTQTRGKLSDGEGYCCLGVACEIYRRETGNGEWVERKKYNRERHRGNANQFLVSGERFSSFLPKEVREWFGFNDDPPNNYLQSLLINMNDGLLSPHSFSDIAKAIEKDF